MHVHINKVTPVEFVRTTQRIF